MRSEGEEGKEETHLETKVEVRGERGTKVRQE